MTDDEKKTPGPKPVEPKSQAGRAADSPARVTTNAPASKTAAVPMVQGYAPSADEIKSTGGTTDEAADEYAAAGVDPALDNRTGDQRPKTDEAPKPQQVSGE